MDETPNGGTGRTFAYDKLLIATGADARPVKVPGNDLKDIFFMRHQGHVRSMEPVLKTAKNALVLGGGLVGFKAAYGLMKRGLHVVMLIKSGYPLAMQVDDIAGRMILDELVRHGLDVRVGSEVKAFEGDGKVQTALLSDGSTLPCDLVVVGKGVIPSLSFVPKDKIKVDLGIVVDEHLMSTAPDIYAAGDVAELVDIARNIPWVNAIWPEAVSQGRVAGMNMAGRPVKYTGSLGRNVIRIFDLDVMTCGIVNPTDDEGFEIISRRDSKNGTYRKLVFKDNILAGMALVNDIDQGGILVSLIQSRVPVKINKNRLLDRHFNFKQLL